MSILIKGMEMPKSCAFCKIKRRNGKKMVCPLCNEEWDIHDPMSADFRLENCPLILVPPHGRLGDLDAAVEKLKMLREYHSDDSQSGVFIAHGISQCIEVLTGKEAPTIIPAEEGET